MEHAKQWIMIFAIFLEMCSLLENDKTVSESAGKLNFSRSLLRGQYIATILTPNS